MMAPFINSSSFSNADVSTIQDQQSLTLGGADASKLPKTRIIKVKKKVMRKRVIRNAPKQKTSVSQTNDHQYVHPNEQVQFMPQPAGQQKVVTNRIELCDPDHDTTTGVISKSQTIASDQQQPNGHHYQDDEIEDEVVEVTRAQIVV